MKPQHELSLPDELVMNKIYFIRGQKVMLDRDLTEFYQVSTGRLNEQAKRNIKRFPKDFMFQLSEHEFDSLISQIAISKRGGTRKLPFAFTEQGVAMLSGILNSDRAIAVNIQIMRIFTKIRQALMDNSELRLAIEDIRKKTDNNTKNIELAFQYLDELLDKKDASANSASKKRNKIGYK